MEPIEALQLARDAISRAMCPAREQRPPPSVEKKVYGSSLVSKTAKECIQSMLEPDQVDAFYSFRGNGVSEAMLKGVAPSREIRVGFQVPGRDGWWVRLRIDGIVALSPEGHVVSFEAKAHNHPSLNDKESAMRQGLLGLAASWHQRDHFAQPSALAPDALPFIWQPGWKPVGCVTGISPKDPPGITDMRAIDEAGCQQFLDFYSAKAQVVVDGYLAGDPNVGATQWDNTAQGHAEWAGRFEDIPTAGDADLDALVLKERDADLREKLAKEEKDQLRSGIKAWLETKGVRAAPAGMFKVSLSEVKASEYMVKKSAGLQLRVTEVK